jgi:hypothetical protein
VAPGEEIEVTTRATVRPEKWRDAVNRKLGDAHHHWFELFQTELPEWNRYREAGTYLRHLVGAARGVFQVTHTLVGNPRAWPWYDTWLQRLTSDESGLWRTMTELRGAEEHGEGADLVTHEVLVTRGLEGQQYYANYTLLRTLPEAASGISKFTVRFKDYPARPASEVAREYIELCNRFADDFEQANPSIFGARSP